MKVSFAFWLVFTKRLCSHSALNFIQIDFESKLCTNFETYVEVNLKLLFLHIITKFLNAGAFVL